MSGKKSEKDEKSQLLDNDKAISDVALQQLRDFISSGDDVIMQEIMAKLKLIANITSDKVLDTKYLSLYEGNLLTCVYRNVNNQSRTHAHKFFSETINSAFILAFNYMSRNDNNFIKNAGGMILEAIKETIQGLENHKKRYPNDVMHAGKISSLIDMINAKLLICSH